MKRKIIENIGWDKEPLLFSHFAGGSMNYHFGNQLDVTLKTLNTHLP